MAWFLEVPHPLPGMPAYRKLFSYPATAQLATSVALRRIATAIGKANPVIVRIMHSNGSALVSE